MAVAHDPSSILLTGRVAVVTGAARGIGRAIAATFGRFGASLAVCDREAAELAEVPADVTAVLDVRNADAVGSFVDDVRDRLGRVDVLVNNAGGTFFAPFTDVSERGEAALVAENFTQVTGFIRRALPLMGEGGSIINVTSIEAHQASPGFAVYGAMKAAVAHLTRMLALELAPRGVRVNAIAPDAIPTGGEQQIRDGMQATGPGYDTASVPPLGIGTPDDAAGVAVFLAGDLSRFVTGTTIHLDGGNWAAGSWRRTEVAR